MRVSRYVVAFTRFTGRGIWLPQESKAHFGLHWVRPWDNCGECYMDGKRIQCLSNDSQHVPIYLQPFLSNSTRKFKSSPFLHILASPEYAPGTITVNVTWVKTGFNAGQTHRSMCPSIFNHLRASLYQDIGRKLQLFSTPLHLTPQLGVFPWEFWEKVTSP